MQSIQGYALRTETSLPFVDAIEKVTGLLKEEGFGILTEIDVKETLKKKLDVDYKPYRILGACNPPFAHRALNAEHHIGVLLPCNVVVWDEGNYRVVAAMNPNVMASVMDNEEVKNIAAEVSSQIEKVIKSMESY